MGAMDIKPQVEENLVLRLEKTWQPGGGGKTGKQQATSGNGSKISKQQAANLTVMGTGNSKQQWTASV